MLKRIIIVKLSNYLKMMSAFILLLLSTFTLLVTSHNLTEEDSDIDLLDIKITLANISEQLTTLQAGNDIKERDSSLCSSLQEQVSTVVSTLTSVKADLKVVLNRTRNGNRYIPTPLFHSCEEIKADDPNSPSGHYIIVDTIGRVRHVYCYMEALCGSEKGWMRVAYLDMSDPSEKCPDGFRLYEENGVRACGRPSTTSGSCVSTTYPSEGIRYSEVCGKVIGYQLGYTAGTSYSNIDGFYVDGISLTHGNPRSHIWSFISGYQESYRYSYCPCGTNNAKTAPSFVGNDYFCESGAPNPIEYKFYTDDPLWDGKGCGSIEEPCCWVPGLPWFHKMLKNTTTDSIEMRLCCNHATTSEDVPFSIVELYIK